MQKKKKTNLAAMISYRNKLPWINKELTDMIEYKNKLYLKWKKYKSQTNYNNYKRTNTRVASRLKKAKRDYYNARIQRAQSKNKEQWNVINEIIGKNKQRILPTAVKLNEVTYRDKFQIANAFNNYFVHIGLSLAQSIPPTNTDRLKYIKKRL